MKKGKRCDNYFLLIWCNVIEAHQKSKMSAGGQLSLGASATPFLREICGGAWSRGPFRPAIPATVACLVLSTRHPVEFCLPRQTKRKRLVHRVRNIFPRKLRVRKCFWSVEVNKLSGQKSGHHVMTRTELWRESRSDQTRIPAIYKPPQRPICPLRWTIFCDKKTIWEIALDALQLTSITCISPRLPCSSCQVFVCLGHNLHIF